ncbi:uncharacterized protein [Mytilus edulis]|uniref:uncharacterized protein n=1 Tax=Mytilus edulis TaxID=6550 RepID=UPI0039F12A1B
MASSFQMCEPCFRGGEHTQGVSWCSDCEEILCAFCEKAHRVAKLSKSHAVVHLEAIKSVKVERIADMNICEKHLGKNLEAFCTSHDSLCCSSCVFEQHKACEKVLALDEASVGIKSSAVVHDVQRSILVVIDAYDKILQNQKKNKETLAEKETSVKMAIANLKSKVNKHLDSLANSVSIIRDESLLKIEKNCQTILEKRDNLMTHKKNFDFLREHGSESKLFLLTETLKKELTVNDGSIQELLSNIKTQSITFSSLQSDLSAVASVCLEEEPLNIKHEIGILNRAQMVKSTTSLKKDAFIDLGFDEPTPLTGIEVTEDNRILLCYWLNQSVLILDKNGKFILKADVDGDPYGISLIPHKFQAVISMPEAKKVYILNSSNLEYIRHFKTLNECYGIVVLDNNIYAGSSGVISVIKINGQYLRSISLLPNCSSIRYIYPMEDGNLFCTSLHNIFITSVDGAILSTNGYCDEPRGIAIDKNGHVYVADKTSHKVYRFNADGTKIDNVLHITGQFESPQSLRFNRDHTKLYVGFVKSNFLGVFSCS